MSIQRLILRPFLRFQVKRRFQKSPDVFGLRAMMADTAKLAKQPPPSVQLDPVVVGGIKADRFTPDSLPPNAGNSRVLLHIHGGGWVAGSPRNYWSMMWRYARSTGAVAYVPDYRLAPEHPYPAALDDLDNFYSALLDMGVPASGIVVSGDSAGGNLALALMHRLKARNGPMPSGLICLSAATDFTLREGTMVTNAIRDDLFVADMMESPIHHYCPGQDLTNPMISPLQGDLAGFPPTLIHVAETEMLLDSNRLLAAKLQAAGVPVELSVKPKLWHVWHVMADVLPEARSAIEELAQFARERLPAASH